MSMVLHEFSSTLFAIRAEHSTEELKTPPISHFSFSTLLIFHTPHHAHCTFPHFSFFILFIFHTPHFQYFSFSILLIFHTPHFPHSTFSILLIFQTPHFPFFDNKEGLSLGAELKPDSISQCKALQGIATHLKLRHFPTIGSLFLYRLIICEKKKKRFQR